MPAMDSASRAELLDACRVIFGRPLDASFLGLLQESGLRAAWRLKARQTHPDRTLDQSAKRGHTESFIEARRAYGLLQEYLGCRARPPAPAPRRTAHPRREEHRPGPGLPRRRLRFGEYLLHSRAISFPALIEAIVWQRSQRDRFCEVARRWGCLSDREVALLLAGRRPLERVGAAALRLRLLTSLQVRTVLWFQQSRQEPIGAFFVQRGLLSPAALDRLLRRFAEHNTPFQRR